MPRAFQPPPAARGDRSARVGRDEVSRSRAGPLAARGASALGLGQLARASEIATLLSASGFDWLVAALGLRACVSLRCRVVCATGVRQCPHHVDMQLPLPERMRAVLERLGPTFVKAGQMLALRPDYLPLPYAHALRALHDHAEPFPGEQARRLVEAELGAPLGRLFAEFDAEPLAAASLSQVHRGRLPDGRLVAVKVQRPGIAPQMQRDLALLRTLARRLERRCPEALGFRPSAAVAELSEYTLRELDFRAEGRVAERVRRAFADDPQVVIPWIDWDRSARRVLTMELIEGRPPAPAAQLHADGLDAEALLRIGARAMLRQIFELGLFHADPHPGNVLFLPGDRVCFLDFGMFGRIGRRERRRMGFVLWALVDGDYDGVVRRLLALAHTDAASDRDGFVQALEATVEEWYASATGEASIAGLFIRELALGARYGVVFPRELMLLARALVNVDATATLVAPQLSFADLTRPLMGDLRHALIGDVGSLEGALRRRRLDYLELALEAPDLLAELAARFREPSGSPPAPPRQDRPRRAAAVGAGVAAGLAGGLIANRLSGKRS